MPSEMISNVRSDVPPDAIIAPDAIVVLDTIDTPDAMVPASRRSDLLSLVVAAGAGAAAMYLLDPDRGRRRRALIRDKAVRAAHVAGEAAGTTSRDLANHARGFAAVAKRRFSGDASDDVVIVERVRSALGRVVSHPGSVVVTCDEGLVTLSGPVLASEADKLVSEAGSVRGVQEVVDRLERHEDAASIPALQGGSARGPRAGILQENWTPALRLASAVTGGALAVIAFGEKRRNPVIAAVGLAGAALLARGATNRPFIRMVGADAARRVAARITPATDREVEIERVPLESSTEGEAPRDDAGAQPDGTNVPPAAW